MAIDRLATVKKAEGLVHAGQIESAIDEYARVFEEYPDDWGVANTLGDLHLRAGQKGRAAELFLQIGEAFQRQGFVPKAVALYKKTLKARPGDEHALARLAMVAVQQELFADARLYYGQLLQQRRQRGDSAGVAECEARLAVLPDRRAPAQSGKTAPAPPPAALAPPDDARPLDTRPSMPSPEALPTAAAFAPGAAALPASAPPAPAPAGFATGVASSATAATTSDAAVSEAMTDAALPIVAVPNVPAPNVAAANAAILELPDDVVIDAPAPDAPASGPVVSGAAVPPVTAVSQSSAATEATPAARRPETPAGVTPVAPTPGAWTDDPPIESAVPVPESAAVPAGIVAPAPYVLERFGDLPTPDQLELAPTLVPVTAPRAIEEPVDAEPAGFRTVNGPAGACDAADAPAIVEVVELGDLLDEPETESAPAVLTPVLQAVTVPMAPVVASTTVADVAMPVTNEFRALETELLLLDANPSEAASKSAGTAWAGFAPPLETRAGAPAPAVIPPALTPADQDRSAALADAVATPGVSPAFAHAIAELEAAAASPAFGFRAAAELGRLWLRQGDLPQAARWLERAADVPAPIPEQGVSVRYDLGDTLERMNAVVRALDVFRNIAMDAGEYRDVRARISRLEARQASGSVT